MRRSVLIILVILIMSSLFGCKIKRDDEEAILTTKQSAADDNSDKIVLQENQQSIYEENSDIAEENITQNDENSDIPEENVTQNDEILDTDIENSESTEIEVNNQNEGNIEYDSRFDSVPLMYLSVSDMIDSLKTKVITDIRSDKSSQDDRRFDVFETDNIKYFYMLKNGIPGYELSIVSVSYNAIEFCYDPIGQEKRNGNPMYYNQFTRIYVSYKRADRVTENIMSNQGDQLTDDGFIYNQSLNQICFSAGESTISITVPDSMNNYETLKPLCVAEKITVE